MLENYTSVPILYKTVNYVFLKNAPITGEFVHIKAAVVIGFCKGLRCTDMVWLNIQDCTFDETTVMWIDYNVSKHRREAIRNKFNVPLEF